MSKDKEAAKDPKNDDGGGSALTEKADEQKEDNLRRIEELLDVASPAFLAAMLDLVARAVGRGWQTKKIIEGIGRVLDQESVAPLLPVWEKLLGPEGGD